VGLIDDIETIYQQIEWVNFGGYTDKPCISMSYILLNRHAEIVEQTFEDDNGRSGRPKSCKALLANNDGLRKKLIDYLANFHYIAELAQNETSHICD
jgi:hypothetical protein